MDTSQGFQSEIGTWTPKRYGPQSQLPGLTQVGFRFQQQPGEIVERVGLIGLKVESPAVSGLGFFCETLLQPNVAEIQPNKARLSARVEQVQVDAFGFVEVSGLFEGDGVSNGIGILARSLSG